MKHMVITLLCVASFASAYCGDKKDLNEKKDSISAKAPLTDQERIANLEATVAALQEKLKKTEDERDTARGWQDHYKYQLDNPRKPGQYRGM